MESFTDLGWAIAVDVDIDGFAYPFEQVVRREYVGLASSVYRPVRVILEAQRNAGGVRALAVLGGTYSPSSAATAVVEVGAAGELSLDSIGSCPGMLKHPYVPGLPEELAEAVLAGFAMSADAGELLSGEYLVDRGGFDVYSSAPLHFRRVARALERALAAVAGGRDPLAAAVAAVRP